MADSAAAVAANVAAGLDDKFVHKPYEAPATYEVMEQDSGDIEDTEDIINTVVLPPGTLPDNCEQLGMMYSRKVFRGWVKQPSHL
jgi:hypothetical protein